MQTHKSMMLGGKKVSQVSKNIMTLNNDIKLRTAPRCVCLDKNSC